MNKQNGIAAVWFMKNEPDAAVLFCMGLLDKFCGFSIHLYILKIYVILKIRYKWTETIEKSFGGNCGYCREMEIWEI